MLVVGLGNPGRRYEGTRHNVGFDVLDTLASRRGLRFRSAPFWRPVARVARDDGAIWIKPSTWMNRSGRAIVWAQHRYAIGEARCLAVFDDADLPLGQLRLRSSGGHGGHNGVRSLMEELGNGDFDRIRIGVAGNGRRDGKLADYLLARFDSDEEEIVARSVALAADAVSCVLERGFEHAMNLFNHRR